MRQKQFEGIDWESVAEEIAGVADYQRDRLESNLFQILLHLLKTHYQPGMRTRIWDLTIAEHRHRGDRILAKNPSLGSEQGDILIDAYNYARLRAASQTGIELAVFPVDCQWSFSEVLGHQA